jgi:hypothetical protein
MPSFLKDGIYIVKLEEVGNFEVELARIRDELNDKLVPAFIEVYPSQVIESREALGIQFNEVDYPQPEALRASFKIQWNWISFSVPDKLPEGVRQQEIEKLQKSYQDAQTEIIASLRAGFGEMVKRIIERLKPDPSGKKKIIKDSFIENFDNFVNTFQAKNLMDDTELADTVGKAKALLEGISAESLRDSANLRESIKDDFETIKAEVDKLIQDAPSRRFDFEEEN